MAKENKYLQFAKSRKGKKADIDLQQIAKEYQKLLNKRFRYIFQENIVVEFQFRMKNFYHLLGFHKLTDVSAVKMVENHQMKKEDFFKYVLSGKITLNKTDESIVEDENIVNVSDTKKVSDFGEIKAHRFAYFSEENVLELLLSDPVIDFENSESNTLIEADKIFFKLQKNKMRNLNLFIGFDEKIGKHFTSTFFLEMEQNKYRLKRDGNEQPILYILSRAVYNTMTNKLEDFTIKWENVRKELSSLSCYRAQSRLKTWISSRHIQSVVVEQEIKQQQKMAVEYDTQIKELQQQLEILKLIERLAGTEEEKEQAVLALMDLGLDAENEAEISTYVQMDIKNVKDDLRRIEGKAAALNNKMKKFVQFLPELHLLEVEEVKLAYQPYLSEIQLENETLLEMIGDGAVYSNIKSPDDFLAEYHQYNLQRK